MNGNPGTEISLFGREIVLFGSAQSVQGSAARMAGDKVNKRYPAINSIVTVVVSQKMNGARQIKKEIEEYYWLTNISESQAEPTRGLADSTFSKDLKQAVSNWQSHRNINTVPGCLTILIYSSILPNEPKGCNQTPPSEDLAAWGWKTTSFRHVDFCAAELNY